MQNRSDEFKNLSWSAESLQLALERNPSLITEQDEDGLTLLHHAVQIGCIMGSSNASKILNVLFNTQSINFTIKDNLGNTPVHVAALCCKDRVTCQFIFPTIVKEAVKHGFDFSTLGEHGQSVLQIATIVSYTDPRGLFGRINNVKNVLDNAPNPGLNALSTSGSTAFFYAVNHCHFAEAKALLQANANPMLFGSKDRDPFAMIETHLKIFTEYLSKDEYADKHEYIQTLIGQLNELKQMMLSVVVKDHAEIRKCARILAQGARTGSIFERLPNEALIKIAAHTASIHTQEEAENIVEKHLNRPSI